MLEQAISLGSSLKAVVVVAISEDGPLIMGSRMSPVEKAYLAQFHHAFNTLGIQEALAHGDKIFTE